MRLAARPAAQRLRGLQDARKHHSLLCALVLGFPAIASAGNRPVVVELFTSEGCSSCPPADTYLTELAHGRRTYWRCAYHVTYWNSLGWKDPYSLRIATERQAAYGARFGDGSYTPEMVIDGKRSAVGSDREKVENAIKAAKSDSTRGALKPDEKAVPFRLD